MSTSVSTFLSIVQYKVVQSSVGSILAVVEIYEIEMYYTASDIYQDLLNNVPISSTVGLGHSTMILTSHCVWWNTCHFSFLPGGRKSKILLVRIVLQLDPLSFVFDLQ